MRFQTHCDYFSDLKPIPNESKMC